MAELALILALAVVGQLVSRAARVPAILVLLLLGLAAGGWLGWVDPDALFGDLLFDGVDLAVAVILFEGGLVLDFDELGRDVSRAVRRLLTWGVLATALLAAGAAVWLLGMAWPVAAVFGAIMTVSGPTVVLPLLRFIGVDGRVQSILKWEGVFIDAVGATLAVLVYETVVAGAGEDLGLQTMLAVLGTLGVGLAIGLAGATILVVLLSWERLDSSLSALASLAMVIAAFVVADELRHEAGLMAAIVMGVALANQDRVPSARIVQFKETLGVLLTSVLFIVLSARLDLGELVGLGGTVAAFIAVLVVVRSLVVGVATLGSDLTARERGFIGWMAPRGIVAAATASVFGSGLEELGLRGAEQLVPATFLTILGTVALYGLTGRPVASLLGLRSTPSSTLEQAPDQAGAMTREEAGNGDG